MLANSTVLHFPSAHSATTSTGPPGMSRRRRVSGSRIGIMPVSSRTVAAQIEFEPDIRQYSVGSMMITPASQSARVGGTIRFT